MTKAGIYFWIIIFALFVFMVWATVYVFWYHESDLRRERFERRFERREEAQRKRKKAVAAHIRRLEKRDGRAEYLAWLEAGKPEEPINAAQAGASLPDKRDPRAEYFAWLEEEKIKGRRS